MAFNPSTGQMILFGGFDGSDFLNDTWVFDGNTWTQLSLSSSPTVRQGASMAFNPCNGQLLLFGGYNGSSYLNDTYTFDGNTWTKLTLSPTPSARQGASMTFNPCNGQIILFGGYNGNYLDDTWDFNGIDNVNTWTKLTPSTPPGARDFASMAFDPSGGQIILFGGKGSTGLLNDTWAFNGIGNANTWTHLALSNPPAARYGASMAFNPSKGIMLLFGGQGSTKLLNDTWAFDARDNVDT